jgi:putative ABC transport system permease protein
LSGLNYRDDFSIAGVAAATQAEAPGAQSRRVSPGYFRVMRIPLVRGREFSESDNGGARRVAVVDETLAQRFFAGRDPVGSRLVFGKDTLEVVGLVRAARYFGLEDDPLPTLYLPLAQVSQSYLSFITNGISFAVRSAAVSPEIIRRELRAVDSEVPATNVRTMEESLAGTLASRRFNLFLLGTFAVSALLLAALGLYAVVSFAVSEQARELAIRSALGAPRDRLVRQVLSANLRQLSAGIVLGAAGAAVLAPLVSALLFHVRPLDAAVYGLVAGVLAGSGLTACYIPARKAAAADPVEALRGE